MRRQRALWSLVVVSVLGLLVATPGSLPAQASSSTPSKPRVRDLGLPIGGTAGPLDAITDVAGVEVGHTTLI